MTETHEKNHEPSEFEITQGDLDRVAKRIDGNGPPQELRVTYYAYDPQTYEILCRPGQQLSPKKAQRLQELNLYAQIVTFTE